MSRSTMGTCEGTSKSHIGQSVGRGGKFRNQIYASCNLKIPHKDKNKRGNLENPVYYVHFHVHFDAD